MIGKWQSPRHTYVFTADHRYGMEDGPMDETWQIRGTQMTLGSDTYRIILLDADYLVLGCETGALFYTRVKE